MRAVHEKCRDHVHACLKYYAYVVACEHPEDARAHVRTVHERRRDHACPHCAAAFGEAGHLKTHVRAVHEKCRDHACPHCAAASGRASHLTRHVRTQHPATRRSANLAREEPDNV